MLSEIQQKLLKEVDNFHNQQNVAYSLRVNGKTQTINSTDTIKIEKKKSGQGLNITIKSSCKPQVMHMPVIMDVNITEEVINDFVIKDKTEITIVAGCGIHNTSSSNSASHNGIHNFVIGKNCKVKYIEKHIGLGLQSAQKIISPLANITIGKNSSFEIETVQLGGVNLAHRQTNATLGDNAKFIVSEKVLTESFDIASSEIKVELLGKNSHCKIKSRAVAKGMSKQTFKSDLIGQNICLGHVECDGILLDKANISSTPSVIAKSCEANLSHEAQIGKIAGDQLIKLMSLGLSKKEAENKIISGYLLN